MQAAELAKKEKTGIGPATGAAGPGSGGNGDSSGNLLGSGSGSGFGSAQWKAMHMGSMRLKKMGDWIQ
jgi:hypothetical protein